MGWGSGVHKTRIVGGPVSFYDNYTTTNLYVERPFGGDVNSITISNDSDTDTIVVSFDGATVKSELIPGESITLNAANQTSIWVRGVVGGGGVRIWAW
jgi:hypothetical protein